MSSTVARIAALESLVAQLQSENTALKTCIPLSAITEGVKAATPEDLAAWMAACKAAKEDNPSLVAPSKKAKAKKAAAASEGDEGSVSSAKSISNPTGPAAWNAIIRETWEEMAAAAGVVMESHDGTPEGYAAADKAFKKAAKAAGITFEMGRHEASIRKRAAEGKDAPVLKEKAAKEPKAAKETKAKEPKAKTGPTAQEKVAAAKAAKAMAAATAAAPAPAPASAAEETEEAEEAETPVDSERAKQKEAAEAAGLVEMEFEGEAFFVDMTDGSVMSYDMADVIGSYDTESKVFTRA